MNGKGKERKERRGAAARGEVMQEEEQEQPRQTEAEYLVAAETLERWDGERDVGRRSEDRGDKERPVQYAARQSGRATGRGFRLLGWFGGLFGQ